MVGMGGAAPAGGPVRLPVWRRIIPAGGADLLLVLLAAAARLDQQSGTLGSQRRSRARQDIISAS